MTEHIHPGVQLLQYYPHSFGLEHGFERFGRAWCEGSRSGGREARGGERERERVAPFSRTEEGLFSPRES